MVLGLVNELGRGGEKLTQVGPFAIENWHAFVGEPWLGLEETWNTCSRISGTRWGAVDDVTDVELFKVFTRSCHHLSSQVQIGQDETRIVACLIQAGVHRIVGSHGGRSMSRVTVCVYLSKAAQ